MMYNDEQMITMMYKFYKLMHYIYNTFFSQ